MTYPPLSNLLDTQQRPSVSLIIPAHNEESRLSQTVWLYHREFWKRYGTDFELLIVCNGCTDSTEALATLLANSMTGMRVIRIAEAVGKGGAVLAGFLAASGRDIVFADADAATAPQSLFGLLDELLYHDVVIGSRRLPGSVILEQQPPLRRLFGFGFASLIQTLFKLNLKDTQCGAKAFRAPAAGLLAHAVQERYWTFDVDLLLHTRRMGLSVAEVPVIWSDREGSKLRLLPTLRQVLASLAQMRRVHRTPGRPGWLGVNPTIKRVEN